MHRLNPHLHVDAVDSNGNSVNTEKRNYGLVSNQQFFSSTGFNGDYKLLKAYKDGLRTGNIEQFNREDYTEEEWNLPS